MLVGLIFPSFSLNPLVRAGFEDLHSTHRRCVIMHGSIISILSTRRDFCKSVWRSILFTGFSDSQAGMNQSSSFNVSSLSFPLAITIYRPTRLPWHQWDHQKLCIYIVADVRQQNFLVTRKCRPSEAATVFSPPRGWMLLGWGHPCPTKVRVFCANLSKCRSKDEA